MSNFVQNYKIKVDRQLFSLLVGVAVFLIFYAFGRIADAVKAEMDKPAKPAARRAKPVAPAVAPPLSETKGFRPESLKPEEKAASTDRRKPATAAQRHPAVPVVPTGPKQGQGAMTLRQAVVWSEILKRKY